MDEYNNKNYSDIRIKLSSGKSYLYLHKIIVCKLSKLMKSTINLLTSKDNTIDFASFDFSVSDITIDYVFRCMYHIFCNNKNTKMTYTIMKPEEYILCLRFADFLMVKKSVWCYIMNELKWNCKINYETCLKYLTIMHNMTQNEAIIMLSRLDTTTPHIDKDNLLLPRFMKDYMKEPEALDLIKLINIIHCDCNIKRCDHYYSFNRIVDNIACIFNVPESKHSLLDIKCESVQVYDRYLAYGVTKNSLTIYKYDLIKLIKSNENNGEFDYILDYIIINNNKFKHDAMHVLLNSEYVEKYIKIFPNKLKFIPQLNNDLPIMFVENAFNKIRCQKKYMRYVATILYDHEKYFYYDRVSCNNIFMALSGGSTFKFKKRNFDSTNNCYLVTIKPHKNNICNLGFLITPKNKNSLSFCYYPITFESKCNYILNGIDLDAYKTYGPCSSSLDGTWLLEDGKPSRVYGWQKINNKIVPIGDVKFHYLRMVSKIKRLVALRNN